MLRQLGYCLNKSPNLSCFMIYLVLLLLDVKRIEKSLFHQLLFLLWFPTEKRKKRKKKRNRKKRKKRQIKVIEQEPEAVRAEESNRAMTVYQFAESTPATGRPDDHIPVTRGELRSMESSITSKLTSKLDQILDFLSRKKDSSPFVFPSKSFLLFKLLWTIMIFLTFLPDDKRGRRLDD